MRHFVIFEIECDGQAPPGLLSAVAEATGACVRAAGTAVHGTLTQRVLEDPALADPEHLPDGYSITVSEESFREHAGLVELFPSMRKEER